MKATILIILIGTVIRSFSQVSVTLTVFEDVAIGYHDGANTAGNNYGNAAQNAAFCIPAVADPSGVNVNRALFRFDYTSIPAGATVLSASLNLYALGPYGSLSGHMGTGNGAYVERILQPWQEYQATWINQPATTTANRVTLSPSSNSSQNYLNINVTGMVKDMIAGNTNYGFKLRMVSEVSSNALVFASKDCGTPGKFPRLVVTYCVNKPGTANCVTAIEPATASTTDAILFRREGNYVLTSGDLSTVSELRFTDLSGKVLRTLRPENGQTELLIGGDLTPGIYICSIVRHNTVYHTKVCLL